MNRTEPKVESRGLRLILTALLQRAVDQPGKTQGQMLANGLRIQLRYDAGALTVLAVRQGEAPASQAEWLTICNYMPASVPFPEDRPSEYCWQDWKGLRASWRWSPPE